MSVQASERGRSAVTVAPNASLSAEAGERWADRVRQQQQQAAAQEKRGPPQAAELTLHPRWRGFLGGLAAGGASVGVAAQVLRRKGVHRLTDRSSIIFMSFAVPFMLVANFTSVAQRQAEDTLHPRRGDRSVR